MSAYESLATSTKQSDLQNTASQVAALATRPAAADYTPADGDRDRAPRESQIMIIDDEIVNIEIVQAYLEEEGFVNFTTTTESVNAANMMKAVKPAIVLLDIKMPQVSGLDILQRMRHDDQLKYVPVIILTVSADSETKMKALNLGASDFLAKPVDPSELLVRLENVLAVKAYQDHLSDYSERLEQQVQIRTNELFRSRQEAIHCLARAAEYRDDDTGRHVLRVGRYSRIVADQLGFPEPAVEILEQAAQLHDIGKIGIPDGVLRKPGALNPEEYDLIKRHCAMGRRIIQPMALDDVELLRQHTSLGADIMAVASSSPVFKVAALIAETHHEKWDGSGYPLGLKGTDIPIEGRIVAVADVFDAISSDRPYKRAFPLDKSLEIIEEGRGKHFDPQVVDAFFARKDDIIRAQMQFMDMPLPSDDLFNAGTHHSA
jgi:putative two-component system response regulator